MRAQPRSQTRGHSTWHPTECRGSGGTDGLYRPVHSRPGRSHESAREEATQDSPPTEAYVQTERGHCIGQGWHLPSVVAFLVIALEQVLPVESTTAPPLLTWHRERWMEPCSMPPSQRDHIFHTAAGMLATFTPPEDIPPEYLRKLDVSGSGTTPTQRALETRIFARCPSRHGPVGP